VVKVNAKALFTGTLRFLCLFILLYPACAQDNDAARLYRAQFINLHANTKQMLARADELVRAAPTDASIPNLRQEISLLRNHVNELRVKSTQSNQEELKNGEFSNKTFLLVSAGCDEITFVLQALDGFLDTRDRDFFGLAKRGEDLTSSLEQAILTVEQDSSSLEKSTLSSRCRVYEACSP
jgi:hypothetical protein